MFAKGSLFRASACYALASLGAYVLSLVKAIIVARFFGTTSSVDAFSIAVLVPNLAATLIAGSTAAALVPVLSQAERKGPGERAKLFRSGLVFFAVLSCLFVLLLWFGSSSLVRVLASNFSTDQQHLTIRLLNIAAPMLLFATVAAYCTGELLYRRRYFVAAGAPAMVTLTSIVLLFIWSKIGISILVIGLVVGTAIQACVVSVLAWRSNSDPAAGPIWNPFVSKLVVQQLALTFVASIGVVNGFVDQAIAALLPAGTVAGLNFANTVHTAVTQIIVMAISWVVFPDFAEMFAAADHEKVQNRAVQVVTVLVLVAGAATALIIGTGDEWIRLLFQHGRFDQKSTALVFHLWVGYSLGLVPLAIGMIPARLLSAAGRNQVLGWIGAGTLLLNIVFDLLLMRLFGPLGISLSTSVIYVLTAILNLMAVRKILGIRLEKAIGNLVWPLLVCALSITAFVVLRVQLGDAIGLLLGCGVWIGMALFLIRSSMPLLSTGRNELLDGEDLA